MYKQQRTVPAQADHSAESRLASRAAYTAGIVTIAGVGVRVTGLLPKHHLLLLALFALTDLLILVTLAGLWRTNVFGNSRAAKIGLVVAGFGYTMDIPGELLTDTSPRTATTLSAVGSLLFAVGMIVAGISMLKAPRWHGWHRFVPVGLGAYFPVVVMPSLILRVLPDVAFALLGVLYLVLGLAVQAEQKHARVMLDGGLVGPDRPHRAHK